MRRCLCKLTLKDTSAHTDWVTHTRSLKCNHLEHRKVCKRYFDQACGGPGTHSQGLSVASVPMVITHSAHGLLPTQYSIRRPETKGNQAAHWVQTAQRLPASQPDAGSCSSCQSHISQHTDGSLVTGATEKRLDQGGFMRFFCSNSFVVPFITLLVMARCTTLKFSSYSNLPKKLHD